MADLVSVEVETLLGARYVFPDMQRAVLDPAIKVASDQGQLTFVNVSGACLTMKMRIVKTITYDGEVRWRGPAAST